MAGNANSGMKPCLARMRLAARLRRRGKTLQKIGQQLGVTRQAVLRRRGSISRYTDGPNG
jgi:hypothetical protein